MTAQVPTDTSIYESETPPLTPSSSSSSRTPSEEIINTNNIISRPANVLYRYHKTPIQVFANSYTVYDFPLGAYNALTLKRTEPDYCFIKDLNNKDIKKRKGGLFGSLRRKKNNNNNKKMMNINISHSNRNSIVYEEEIRRYSV
ncbi:14909_t:CDS:1 [Funneliformis geosporum]|uniref:1113_t:CDS:1 n=1 Tax=Funneliformis geosporum TaxID=1117311 RepID=A0A9W4SLJ6_9GLOM|nr:14909_t:CDS:1 [Funneliformis geosporum]CAI2173509.1 1113_t:CDS:1 [Funneliformis geosporum]